MLEFEIATLLRRQTRLMSDSTFPGPTTTTRSIRPAPAFDFATTTVTPAFHLDRGRSQLDDDPACGRASKDGIETGLPARMATPSLVDDPRQTRRRDEVPIRRLERQQSDDQAVPDRHPGIPRSGRVALDGGTFSKAFEENTAATRRAVPGHAQMFLATGLQKFGKPVHRSTSAPVAPDAPASASNEAQRQSVSLCCSTRVHLPFAVGVSREKSPRRSTCVMT